MTKPIDPAQLDKCEILERVMALEIEVHDKMHEIKRCTDLYNLGYRYMTPEGKPHMGQDNVINITKRLI